MAAPARPGWRRLWLAFGLLLLVPVALLLAQNALLNIALPPLLNLRPERLHIDYDVAWMVVPGRVKVRGLRIRGQGPTDQWLISADAASGAIALDELLHRGFHASELAARGVSVRYRRRADIDGLAPQVPGLSLAPPISGLSNPPHPDPELIYPPRDRRWTVRLDDVEAEDVREVWIGDYRLAGAMRMTAQVAIADPYIDVDVAATLVGVRAMLGEAPVADNVMGELAIVVASMDRRFPGPSRLRSISAKARVSIDVEDLSFLDFYLQAVPWLYLTGVGHAELDVAMEAGQLQYGSAFRAAFPALVLRIVSNDVTGSGTISAGVVAGPGGQPEAQLVVNFEDFAITPDGGAGTLVQVQGFHVEVRSPELALDQPFSAVSVDVHLPDSQVTDITVYNRYLPQDIGLALVAGTGVVRGHLVASSTDNHASGDLDFKLSGVQARLDALTIAGDLALHAQLADAQLDIGRYDLSGTTLALNRVRLIDAEHRGDRDGKPPWSASVVLRSGIIDVAAPIYLDTRLSMECSDASPFVAVFAEKTKMPAWVEGLLAIPDLKGEARLRFGRNTLELDPCEIRGGDRIEVALRYHRVGPTGHGALFARAGPLSLGVALDPTGRRLKLFGSRRWFDAREE